VYGNGAIGAGVSVAPVVASSYVYQKPIRPPHVMIAPIPVISSMRVPGAAHGVAVAPPLLELLLVAPPLLDVLEPVAPPLLELPLVAELLVPPPPLELLVVPGLPDELPLLPESSPPKLPLDPPPSSPSLLNPGLCGWDAQPCAPSARAPSAKAGRSSRREENMGTSPCVSRGSCPRLPHRRRRTRGAAQQTPRDRDRGPHGVEFDGEFHILGAA